MIALTINNTINEACTWISKNPSYVLWPALIGIIILVLAIYWALKSKASKNKMTTNYQKACDDLKARTTQLTALKKEKENQTIQIQKCQSDLKSMRKELESKMSEIATRESEYSILSRKLDQLNASIEEKDARLCEMEKSLLATRKQLESFKQLVEAERIEHQRVLQENQAKLTSFEELTSRANTLSETLEVKTAEISSLKKRLEERESDIAQLYKLLSDKVGIIEQKEKDIKSLETQLEDARKTLEEKSLLSAPENSLSKDKSSEPDGHILSYNEINKHNRDSLLHFDSENHVYTLNGCEFKSVTSIVDDCFEQFDADYWAKKKAPGLGMTPQQVKAMWERKGEESRNLGSLMHEKIERFYLGLPNTPDETYNLFCQFTQKHHLKPYRTEWAIYDEDSKVAGTLDFLNFDDGAFTIYDWKRSNKIIVNGLPEKTSRWGKRAFSPIGHIHDTTYWHYALQVSIYRYILEKNYGINVSAGRLAVFHPDYNHPYVVDVPYMRDEVMAVLKKRR